VLQRRVRDAIVIGLVGVAEHALPTFIHIAHRLVTAVSHAAFRAFWTYMHCQMHLVALRACSSAAAWQSQSTSSRTHGMRQRASFSACKWQLLLLMGFSVVYYSNRCSLLLTAFCCILVHFNAFNKISLHSILMHF
jgi:hypothetical protein